MSLVLTRMHGMDSGRTGQAAERRSYKEINRTRQAVLPPNPKSLQELEDIPDEFQRTLNGDQFLLWDSMDDADDDNDVDDDARRSARILIFATRGNIRKLCASTTWLLDGTFKVARGMFTQIFTIHGLFRGAAFPFVYALLPNKTERASLQCWK